STTRSPRAASTRSSTSCATPSGATDKALRRWRRTTTASPPAASAALRLIGAGPFLRQDCPLEKSLPVLEHLGRAAVDLQPRHRLVERRAMHQRATGARRRLEIQQSMLQPENLAQPLDVASRQLHPAERCRRLPLPPPARPEKGRAPARRK